MSALTNHESPRVPGSAAPGKTDSAARLLPLVYDELRRLARARMAKLSPGQTLTPTELVHEAYLRIAVGHCDSFEGRRHFFFAVSRAMRDLLVEGARRKGSLKRGGSYRKLAVETVYLIPVEPVEDVLDLDFALKRLERKSPDRARVVQLSYFGGLTHSEIAEVLGLSRATIERRWTYARIWLRRELSRGGRPARTVNEKRW